MQDRALPKTFYITTTRSYQVDWTFETTLKEHLDGELALQMWSLADACWETIEMEGCSFLAQEQKSILLRAIGVKFTIGLGREIVALEGQVARFEAQEEEPLLDEVCATALRGR